jgi:hypothetical protein
MTTAQNTTPAVQDPRTQAAFRTMKALVGSYLTISTATLVAIILLRNHGTIVTSAVWVRGTIVVATALLMLGFATRTAKGSSRAYLRLRIASAIMIVAIAAIIAVPGAFPIWMKVEQGACGLILIGVAAIANGRRMRSWFAGR